MFFRVCMCVCVCACVRCICARCVCARLPRPGHRAWQGQELRTTTPASASSTQPPNTASSATATDAVPCCDAASLRRLVDAAASGGKLPLILATGRRRDDALAEVLAWPAAAVIDTGPFVLPVRRTGVKFADHLENSRQTIMRASSLVIGARVLFGRLACARHRPVLLCPRRTLRGSRAPACNGAAPRPSAHAMRADRHAAFVAPRRQDA